MRADSNGAEAERANHRHRSWARGYRDTAPLEHTTATFRLTLNNLTNKRYWAYQFDNYIKPGGGRAASVLTAGLMKF